MNDTIKVKVDGKEVDVSMADLFKGAASDKLRNALDMMGAIDRIKKEHAKPARDVK